MSDRIHIADIDTKVFTADTAEELKDKFDDWRSQWVRSTALDLVQVVSLSGDKPAIMVIFTPYS